MMLKQAEKISKSGFKPDVIVGVSRGGWIPARILSDLLENSNLANVKVECYEGFNEVGKKATLTQRLSADVSGKRVLVVDEVADSGRSLKLVTQHIQEQGASQIKTAALYYKRDSAFTPDYYEEETYCWVVFPWEIKETVRSIYTKHKNRPARLEDGIAKLKTAGIPNWLTNRFVKELSRDK